MVLVMPIGMASAIPAGVIVSVLPSFPVRMVTDNHLLPVTAFVSAISLPVYFAMTIGGWFVDHYLVSPVYIIGPISWREGCRKDPASSVQVDILLPGHIIVDIDIGHVIVIDMIVSDGPPLWLGANVNIEAHLNLGMPGY